MQIPQNLNFYLSTRGENLGNSYDNNIAFHVGDDAQNPTQNLKNILKNHKQDFKNLAYLNQVHGVDILHAKHGGNLGSGDGILITQKGIIGLIMVADCNPVLLFDKKNKILLMLHAGRAGVEQEIILKGFFKMQKEFNSQAKDIFAYIGPSIKKCCYEVGDEVFSKNLKNGKILKNEKIYVDLTKILKEQFASLKITDSYFDSTCTCCDSRYFSYRREKICGRFGLFANLI